MHGSGWWLRLILGNHSRILVVSNWATPLLRKARECSFLRLEWTGGFVTTKWSVYPMKWHVHTYTHMHMYYMYMYMRASVVSVWQNTHGAQTELARSWFKVFRFFFLFLLQMFGDWVYNKKHFNHGPRHVHYTPPTTYHPLPATWSGTVHWCNMHLFGQNGVT